MTTQSHAIRRSPRVRLPCTTPAVLRSKDGSRYKGELQVVSLTGGLVCLPTPLVRRSRVKVRLLTRVGAIHGSVEMLTPVSSDLQPFRFVALADRNQRRLRTAIQLYLAQSRVEGELIDDYRVKRDHRTFFGDLLGYDADGDDILGANRDPEQNCPICGVAGHNHTVTMTKECATKLVSGDDQTGKATEPMSNSHSRIAGNESQHK
jgi:hypothetical protein